MALITTRLTVATAGGLSGWSNGDFNYDGTIDGSDYSLIDNTFNLQGATSLAAVSNSDCCQPGAISANAQ